jgi:hypothetical protein
LHGIILSPAGIYIFLRLKSKTTIANSTTTVGPQMPPFCSSGSGAFTGSCSGGGVSTGGEGGTGDSESYSIFLLYHP